MKKTPRQPTPHDPAPDYRRCHLQRGGVYDVALTADSFDDYISKFDRVYLPELVSRLFPAAKPRYLDFACGTGRITQIVAPLCAEAVGVDISPSMLEEARRKCPSVRFVEADLTISAIDMGTFDLATSFRFFGNAQHELRMAALKALHRLLRPEACLIINNHRNPHAIAALLSPAPAVGEGRLDLTYFTFKRLLRTCGFEIVSSRPVGVWMYRYRLMHAAAFESARARRLESLFRHAIWSPFAPCAVIVARRLP